MKTVQIVYQVKTKYILGSALFAHYEHAEIFARKIGLTSADIDPLVVQQDITFLKEK